MTLVALLLGGASEGRAQEEVPRGDISGRVVDAATLRPLPGAVVRLERWAARRAGIPDRAITVDSAGEYHFDDVPPGHYLLRITRLGYVAATIQVELKAAVSPTRVSAGLKIEPVRLSALEVRVRRPPPFLRPLVLADRGASGRLMLSPLQPPEHLGLDIRSLTQTEVVEAVTLAETDLFRALQRTPGVTTRDDFTATLWTRGASWDQTRVYLDGMPLYNPTHAGWLFSAVNPDALGEAVFYPGARPARFGEGAAAVLDLHARSGGGGREGGVQGRGELSLASARVALDGGTDGGELNWMVAARRTYVDLLTRVAGVATANDGLYIPYDFADVVAKVDGRVKGFDYSATGIFERDRLRGGIHGILQANRGRWGNRSGRVTVGVPLGPLRLGLGIGETRFRASILHDDRARLEGDEPTLPPLESLIRHRSLSVQLSPMSGSSAPNWALGFEAVRDTVGYEGPFSLLGELAVVLPRDSAPSNSLTLGSSLRYRAFWAQNRFAFGPVRLEAGVRIESGDSVLNGGELRVAPRLAGSLDLDGATRLSAGWSRTWQYTQDIAPVAGPLGPQLHLTHLWVLAQTAGYAAIRSDVVTGGVETSLSDGWQVGVNAYRRWAQGIEVPNPDSGRIVPDRDPSVQAANRAHGVELLLRKLGGRWSGSIGYTLGFSSMRAEILEPDTAVFEFPGSADVRHALDAMAFVRMGSGVRLGGAFTYGSGVPYTRLILPREGEEDPVVRLGEANAARTPAYASLDLVAEVSRDMGRWELTAYAQLRNALGRNNAVTYAGSLTCSPGVGTGGCAEGVQDRFDAGIPRLPLIGVRFTF